MSSLFLQHVAEMLRAVQACATCLVFSHSFHASKFFISFILGVDIDFVFVPAQVAMLASR